MLFSSHPPSLSLCRLLPSPRPTPPCLSHILLLFLMRVCVCMCAYVYVCFYVRVCVCLCIAGSLPRAKIQRSERRALRMLSTP